MAIIKCDHEKCTFEAFKKKQLAQHLSKEHPLLIIPPAHGYGKRPNAHLVPKETKERVYDLPCSECSRLFLSSKALQAQLMARRGTGNCSERVAIKGSIPVALVGRCAL